MRELLRWDGSAYAGVAMLVLVLFGTKSHETEIGGIVILFLAIGSGVGLWWNHRHSWKWTQICFAVMSVALLRVVFLFDHASLFAIVVWAAALAGMIYLQEQHRCGTLPSALRPEPPADTASAAGAAPQPQPRQPQSNTAEFAYDHKVQRARYTFADIVGMADTKTRLFSAAKEILKGTAKNPRNGVMLHGEPGNGKTMFAEALGGELKVPFMSISYGDTASKWVNETPQRVKAAFEQAKRMGVGVLFIDEFDSFAKSRDGGSHHMDQDLTNVMLTEIVALRSARVILIAATNFLDKLDPAAVREGRFDYKIEIPSPDLEARKAILRKSIGEALGFAAVDATVLESLAQRWEGFSASRLTALGGQLREMRRDGLIGPGTMPFDTGMRAMRRMVGRKGRLPEDVKAIDEIIMPAQSRDKLRDLAFKMKNVHRLEQIGGRIPSGLVFFGPPGTGKTQAAMALAKESGLAFLKTTGAEMMANPDSWDKLVREAKDIRPVIVFIDEADDILRDRRYSNVGTLTNKILTTLDGGGGRVRDVVYVAATNHFDSLDPAAIRGGRFEEKIAFDVPEADDMTRYVDAKLKKLAGSNFACTRETVESLLSALAGRSIADADAVMQKAIDAAAVRKLREGAAEIGPHDVREAARAVFADQAQR
jgi:transitional endoplasmic reticulum ATPase